MSHAQILMCPPTCYGIQYEINPWMNTLRQTDHAEAERQWNALRQILADCGAAIELLEPQPGLPDLVFTANAGLVHRQRVYLSRFKHVQRQGEQVHDARWFKAQGFELRRLPDDVYFEGAGDALFCGDTLFAGYRLRSDARGHHWLGQQIGCRAIPLELVDPYYYHLDTCFCPLNREAALYFPGAFDDYGRRALAELVPRLIAVEPQEARNFACNAVVVGRSVVTNTGCPRLHAELRNLGLATIATRLSEFVKAGGSAKCLTLRLDGEEAAGWKHNSAADA